MKPKLLFTGSSGFLGNNILALLQEKYDVKTLGFSVSEDYNINLATNAPELKESYEIILHAAGKAHSVPVSESEKKFFFDVNLQGTKNLCSGLEQSGIPKSFIFVSTVAVYGLDYGDNITEEAPLNGKDPYALSKILAEKFLTEWCAKNHVVLSIIRPSLIAGPNPPGNLGSMISGIKSRRYLSISGGKARKSILMVQDIAKLVPVLTDKGGIYNVCDSVHPTFRELELLISSQLNVRIPLTIPYVFAKILALLGDLIGKRAPINSNKLNKINKSLTFSNAKAKRELNWTPVNVLENFKII